MPLISDCDAMKGAKTDLLLCDCRWFYYTSAFIDIIPTSLFQGYFEPFEKRPKVVTLVGFRRNKLLPRQHIQQVKLF